MLAANIHRLPTSSGGRMRRKHCKSSAENCAANASASCSRLKLMLYRITCGSTGTGCCCCC